MSETSTPDGKPQVHLSIIAVRRPRLLEETLRSYRRFLFPQIEIASVRANVDPIFGTPEEGEETAALIRGEFPEAVVNRPTTPGLGAAIRHLWSNAPDGHVLHIEDDWLFSDTPDIPQAIDWLEREAGTVGVNFLVPSHGPKGRGAFSEKVRQKRILGLPLRTKRTMRFNTTPGLFDGAFLRGYAERIDTEKCPEKQSRNGWNPGLIAYLDPYRIRFLKTQEDGPLMYELGNQWREERGIVKEDRDGYSTYTYDNEPQT